MLFLIHYIVKPEHRDTAHERIRKEGVTVPEGMKLIEVYHSATQLGGWGIVEANREADLWKLFQHWTDLNVNTITPVLTNEEVKKLI